MFNQLQIMRHFVIVISPAVIAVNKTQLQSEENAIILEQTVH